MEDLCKELNEDSNEDSDEDSESSGTLQKKDHLRWKFCAENFLMPQNARCSLGGNAAISETDTSRTATTSTTQSAIRRRRKLRVTMSIGKFDGCTTESHGKPAGSVCIFNFTVANFTKANELKER